MLSDTISIFKQANELTQPAAQGAVSVPPKPGLCVAAVPCRGHEHRGAGLGEDSTGYALGHWCKIAAVCARNRQLSGSCAKVAL